MTKDKIQTLWQKDMDTLDRTQAVYDKLLSQYESFNPNPTRPNEMATFNIISSQIIKIMETKMKLQLLQERQTN